MVIKASRCSRCTSCNRCRSCRSCQSCRRCRRCFIQPQYYRPQCRDSVRTSLCLHTSDTHLVSTHLVGARHARIRLPSHSYAIVTSHRLHLKGAKELVTLYVPRPKSHASQEVGGANNRVHLSLRRARCGWLRRVQWRGRGGRERDGLNGDGVGLDTDHLFLACPILEQHLEHTAITHTPIRLSHSPLLSCTHCPQLASR